MNLAQIFPILVVDEDEILHTDDHPFCDDGTCPCVQQAVTDGLLTETEAARIAKGEQL